MHNLVVKDSFRSFGHISLPKDMKTALQEADEMEEGEKGRESEESCSGGKLIYVSI